MSSSLLCRSSQHQICKINHTLTPLPICLRLTRAASLNSAINKGLRKSQGVGFRGKEWRKNDDREDVRSGSREEYGAESVSRRHVGPRSRSNYTDDYKTPSAGRTSSFTKESISYGGPEPPRSSVRNTKSFSKSSQFFDKPENTRRPFDAKTSFNRRAQNSNGDAAGFGTRERSFDPHDRLPKSERYSKSNTSERSYRSATHDIPSLFDASDPYEPINRRSLRPESRRRDHSKHPEPTKSKLFIDDSLSRRSQRVELKQFLKDKKGEFAKERPRLKQRTTDEWPSKNYGKAGSAKAQGDDYQRPAQDSAVSGSGYRSVDIRGRSSSTEPRRPNPNDASGEGRTFLPRWQPQTENASGDVQAYVSLPKRDRNMPISIHYTTPASVFLYGTSAVEAALRSNHHPRRKLYRLYVYSGGNRDKENSKKDLDLSNLAKRQRIRVQKCDVTLLPMMDKMAGGRPHNGYILEASPLPQLPITSLGSVAQQDGLNGFLVNLAHQSREDKEINGENTFVPTIWSPRTHNPLVLFLDSVKDPGNLGAIIRTAHFLGVTAIAMSTRSSAPITPIVIKAAAGATESITLFSIKDVTEADFVKNSRSNGWEVYAATAPNGSGLRRKVLDADELNDPLFRKPCLLLLGSEGEGLSKSVAKQASLDVAVAGSGRRGTVDSLNVGVAAGVLVSAFLKKNKQRVESSDTSLGDGIAAAGDVADVEDVAEDKKLF